MKLVDIVEMMTSAAVGTNVIPSRMFGVIRRKFKTIKKARKLS